MCCRWNKCVFFNLFRRKRGKSEARKMLSNVGKDRLCSNDYMRPIKVKGTSKKKKHFFEKPVFTVDIFLFNLRQFRYEYNKFGYFGQKNRNDPKVPSTSIFLRQSKVDFSEKSDAIFSNGLFSPGREWEKTIDWSHCETKIGNDQWCERANVEKIDLGDRGLRKKVLVRKEVDLRNGT